MLYKFFYFVLLIAAFGVSTNASAQQDKPLPADQRVLVDIPEESRLLMRKDMIDLLSALTEIMQSLSAGNLELAATIAENRMGRSAMGKHRQTGMGPGRFMPVPMRNIAWGLHDAASEFATVAAKGDLKQAYTSLNNVVSHCAACHNTFRTR